MASKKMSEVFPDLPWRYCDEIQITEPEMIIAVNHAVNSHDDLVSKLDKAVELIVKMKNHNLDANKGYIYADDKTPIVTLNEIEFFLKTITDSDNY